MNGDKLKMSEVFDLQFKHGEHNDRYRKGYNDCLDDLDQREIDIEALAKLTYSYKWNRINDIWEGENESFKQEFIELAQHLADNMKMWIRRNDGKR